MLISYKIIFEKHNGIIFNNKYNIFKKKNIFYIKILYNI